MLSPITGTKAAILSIAPKVATRPPNMFVFLPFRAPQGSSAHVLKISASQPIKTVSKTSFTRALWRRIDNRVHCRVCSSKRHKLPAEKVDAT